ncbi:MAG: hypothetical protein ACRCVG_01255 [Methanobacteriaceae archaeon]
MFVKCPECGTENEIKDDAISFTCQNCNKIIDKQIGKLMVTCPECGTEGAIENNFSYFKNKGCNCHNCGNFVHIDPKHINNDIKDENKKLNHIENKTLSAEGKLIVGCPYCGANNEINNDVESFVCYSCDNTIEKKYNKSTLTCPKCEIENKNVNLYVYFRDNGVICDSCGNFIPENKKFINYKQLNWEKKLIATDVAKGVGKAAGYGIGTILFFIFAIFALFCVVLVL